MKSLAFAYTKIPNMGDLLNEYIMENVLKVDFHKAKRVDQYELTGIGSFLDLLFTGPNKEDKSIKGLCKKHLNHHCTKTCYTWGTGFLDDYSKERTGLSRNKVEFMAVRGRLSKEVIEKILGHSINPVLGDAGILASLLFDESPSIKYEVGIIPHYKEKDARQVELLLRKNPGAHVIDLQKDPMQVIKEIAECKFIFSSSLHGLIIADAFRRPNMRVYFTDAPLGTGFKFDDYYSAYGIINPAYKVDSEHIPEVRDIINNYSITDAMVKEMQDNLLTCVSDLIKKR